MGSVAGLLSHKLFHLFADFWFLISSYLLPLFSFISTYFFRLKRKGSSLKYNSSSLCEHNHNIDSNYVKAEPEKGSEEDGTDYRNTEMIGLCEKETTEFCFKFKFPTYEEFSRFKRDNADFVSSEAMPSTNTSSYMSNKSFSAFIEELEPISFKIEEVNTEMNVGSSGSRDIDDEEEYLSDKEFDLLHSDAESVHEKPYVNSVNGVNGEEFIEKNYSMTFTSDEGEKIDEENNLHVSDEMESSSMYSDEDGFLSYGDFGGEFELNHLMDIYGQKVESHEEISDFDESQEDDDFDGEDSDIMEELRNLEEDNMINSNKFKASFLSEKDFHEESDNFKYGESIGINANKAIESSDDSEIPDLKNLTSQNSTFLDEDTNKLETLWEHQELMEQLKMELKKVRATGLPTILEESESPKIMEDLKPWKIDEKFQHGNPMGELHKFYKSYRERMRKFDILNYQKMYAIGFLQLKDPQPISTKKTSVSENASILSENLYLRKSKKYENDPTRKFINELLSESEVTYVGQMCLSWEFLHWQYGMALDLWESDPRGIRRYNEVAGEFQQFQVLVQRFIEDEPFQGPRVQSYIKHRSVLRNFLQVPVIREDISNNRKKARRSPGDDYSITSDLLVEIVEESMRILWRFIHADKDTKVKNQKGLQVDLQDPAESEILKEIRKDLQKKERKLKDQLRSTNCILKKFQKCRDDDNSSDQALFFFSKVDMKLVSRVLNMSKLTTDQLAWCRNKLNTISFINRKIHVEPSFSLFPC